MSSFLEKLIRAEKGVTQDNVGRMSFEISSIEPKSRLRYWYQCTKVVMLKPLRLLVEILVLKITAMRNTTASTLLSPTITLSYNSAKRRLLHDFLQQQHFWPHSSSAEARARVYSSGSNVVVRSHPVSCRNVERECKLDSSLNKSCELFQRLLGNFFS